MNLFSEIISKQDWKKKDSWTRLETKRTINFKDYKQNIKILKNIFKKLNYGKFKSTIIIDYDKIKIDVKKLSDLDNVILHFLEDLGYEVSEESYLLGFVHTPDKKVKIISNILDSFKSKDTNSMRKAYDKSGNQAIKKQLDALENLNSELVEKDIMDGIDSLEATLPYMISDEKKYKIVLSIQPRLIASQSTDVGWTSCMNLYDGVNKKFVGSGISEGIIVAYLVKNNDIATLNSPTARVLIKPLKDKNNNIIWKVDKIYGTASEQFRNKVEEIFKPFSSKESGRYELPEKIYPDEANALKFILTDKQKKMIKDNDWTDIDEESLEFKEYVIERLYKSEAIKFIKNPSRDLIELAIKWHDAHREGLKVLFERIPEIKTDKKLLLLTIDSHPSGSSFMEEWINFLGNDIKDFEIGQKLIWNNWDFVNFVSSGVVIREAIRVGGAGLTYANDKTIKDVLQVVKSDIGDLKKIIKYLAIYKEDEYEKYLTPEIKKLLE